MSYKISERAPSETELSPSLVRDPQSMPSSCWGRAVSHLTAEKASLALCALGGGVFSLTVESLQEGIEAIAVAVAGLAFICLTWTLVFAARGDYSAAGKRLALATVLGACAYGIEKMSHTGPYKLVEQRDCGKGVSISRAVLRKLENLPPDFGFHGDAEVHDSSIQWMSKSFQTWVFTLPDVLPDLVLKTGVNGTRTCSQISLGARVVSDHHLNALYVPPATQLKFVEKKSGREMSILVQEKLNFNFSTLFQKELYRKYSGQMDTQIIQTAKFIAKTGFSDVAWRNVPLAETSDPQLPLKVVLHDLDEMQGPSIGMIGNGSWRDGLLGCLFSEKDMDLALDEARKNGIGTFGGISAKEARLAAIQKEPV